MLIVGTVVFAAVLNAQSQPGPQPLPQNPGSPTRGSDTGGPAPMPSNGASPASPAGPSPASTVLLSQPSAPLPLPTAHAAGTIGPIKLRNETIDQVLELLERWTGSTLLRPPTLPGGNYTLTLKEGTTREDAVRMLVTLLNLNGIAVTPLGDGYLKVTALNLARAEAPTFIEGPVKDLPPSGQIASKLFTLQFLRVSEFLPQIAALLNPGLGAAPVIFEKSNSALVTDSISNLQRVEALLDRLDRPFLGGNTTKFYTLTSANAKDVVNQLHALLAGPLQMQLGATTMYQADDRTNQIILISDERQIAFFDDLIAKLDKQADPNTRNQVIFLKNASAKEIASLLSNLVQGRNQATRSTSSDGSRSVGTAPGANPATPPGGPQPSPAVAAIVATEASQNFSDLLTILAEERSNALIVSGTMADIRLIRDLVDQIDVLLDQVRIEVVIAEVTLSDEATSGISALGLKILNNKLVGFSGTAAGVDSVTGSFSNAADGSTQLSADISLVTTPRKNNTTILSVPTIITTHNKEGSIFVGESRPVISSYLNDNSSGTNTGGIGTGYRSTVNSTDIGIELTVKPLIGKDGSVQLEITQEVNDVLGDIIIDGNPQPRIGRRSTKSFISVKSGETIVLGGLQRNTRSRNTNRLGPIPFLGDLLGSRKRENTRTDLVFFLRPYVLTNTPADNADALRRIDTGPQREAVRSALDPSYVPDKDPRKSSR
jgi:general secretion pathway protein D